MDFRHTFHCLVPVLPLVGGQVWTLVHPEFGSSVNPITTMGADYSHHFTASPPGFENPASSLHYLISTEGEHDGIESRLPFKIFSALIMLGTP